MLKSWPGAWEDCSDPAAPHEASRLNLAIDKAHHMLGWSPRWTFEETVQHTVEWYRRAATGESAHDLTLAQIREYRSKPTP